MREKRVQQKGKKKNHGCILPGLYAIVGKARKDILVDNGIFLSHIIACSSGAGEAT